MRAALPTLPVLAAAALAACSSGPAPGPSATAHPSATATPLVPAGSVAPSPSSSVGGVALCPPSRAASSTAALARPPFAPDDLATSADGGLWATDPDAGVLALLDPTSGAVRMSFRDGAAPEGVVPLGGGRIALAEQTRNRVVLLRPPDMTPTVLVDLGPVAPSQGVDGIGLDASGTGLLVPDSHAGRLLDVPLDGSAPRVLATGLGRPVDAAPLPDGSVAVAVEGARGLLRVPGAGGPATPVGDVAQGDDVLVAGGLVYVTSLSAGSVVAVDPTGGGTHVLVTGLGQPQGLAALGGGRIAVADPVGRVIRAFDACR